MCVCVRFGSIVGESTLHYSRSINLLSNEILQHGTFASTLTSDDGDLRQIELQGDAHRSEGILQLIDHRNQLLHACVARHLFDREMFSRSENLTTISQDTARLLFEGGRSDGGRFRKRANTFRHDFYFFLFK